MKISVALNPKTTLKNMIGSKFYRKKDTLRLRSNAEAVSLNPHSGERGIVQPDCMRTEASEIL
jgi:hypothetical protein